MRGAAAATRGVGSTEGPHPHRGTGEGEGCWRGGIGRAGAPEKGSHFIGSTTCFRFYFSF